MAIGAHALHMNEISWSGGGVLNKEIAQIARQDDVVWHFEQKYKLLYGGK
jgi:hypothetical protein